MPDGHILKPDRLLALMVVEMDADRRSSGLVLGVTWPEESHRSSPAVELVAVTVGGEIAVEHTRIESYPNQTSDHAAIDAMFPLGGIEVEGHPQAGRCKLAVPVGAFARLRPKQYKPVAAILTEWVSSHIDAVPEADGSGRHRAVPGSHDDVPWRWSLYCALPPGVGVWGPISHVVGITQYQPPDMEARRIQRLAKALERKVPKLLAVGAGHRRTVLVLEERDNTHSNPAVVTDALRVASAGMELPDAIYVVNVRMGNPLACVLWDEGEWADETPDWFHWLSFPTSSVVEFNPINKIWP